MLEVTLIPLTILLAVVLAYAASIKVVRRTAFAAAVGSWGLPAPARAPIVSALPVSELLAAAVLVSAAFNLVVDPAVSCLVVAVYLAALVAGQVWVRSRGLLAECGCFGRPTPLSAQSIAVAASLAAFAGLLSVGYGL